MKVTPALVAGLAVRNLDASLQFYRNVLGFRVVYERLEDAFILLEREGAQLMLEMSSDSPAPPSADFSSAAVQGPNLHLRISDLDEVERRLAEANWAATVARERWYRRNGGHLGNRELTVRDPDGYHLCLYEEIGAR